MNRTDFDERPRGIYRDSERGMILGVCAGIAGYFDCPLWLVRIGILVLAWFFPISVVVAYVVAAVLMRDRPLRYYGEGDERTFWQSHRHRS